MYIINHRKVYIVPSLAISRIKMPQLRIYLSDKAYIAYCKKSPKRRQELRRIARDAIVTEVEGDSNTKS